MSILKRLAALADISTMPDNPYPPSKLVPYIWHFARQQKKIITLLFTFNAMAATGLAIAPLFLKHIIDVINAAPTPAEAWPQLIPPLAGYIAIALVLRLVANFIYNGLNSTLFTSTYTHAVRRQMHWYVLRHSLTYFQNDFAGRIANKVFDTGSAMRDIVLILTGSLWWVTVSIVISAISLATSSFWLLTPLAVWLVFYAVILRKYIPQIRKRSMEFSDTRSLSMGRTVDAYTNIQTVKLFANGDREDRSLVNTLITARNAHVAMHTTIFRMKSWSDLNNTIFMGTTLALALWLWTHGFITAGSVAMVIPIAVMLTNQAGWIAGELTTFFEQLGTAEETMQVLIKPHTLTDAQQAKPLNVERGEIGFNNITFRYHPEADPVIKDLNLTIAAGQKVGLIGHSGAGKSTLVNLLLRFYELADGTVTIDNQNIAEVTQNSLRSHIGMVTQDTSLLHRSIRANIAYGSPDATEEQIIAAAKMAHAHDFILTLSDKDGNTGYASKVGERGVKLSGGQRQRIAIARLILKNAPILIMDEATSALDSEVEHAIQENLDTLMQDKTVIAIAHRLSTISQLDRLLVLENGRIIEDGTHEQLIRKGGAYAKLWSRQSGGFLPE